MKIDYGSLEFHPLADRYPLLVGPQFDELVGSIRESGLHEPIEVLKSTGTILDGRNRYNALRAAGLTPDKQHFAIVDIDEAELETYVEIKNLHRRHLSQVQQAEMRKARIARVVEARQQGESLRAIAEKEGVSHQQIKNDLDDATVKGFTVEPESGKVVGKDGKERPATQPKKPAPPAPAPAPVAVAEPEPEPEPAADDTPAGPVDAIGVPVGGHGPAFADVAKFDEIRSLLRKAAQLVHELAESPGGAYYRTQLNHKAAGDGIRHYCPHLANAGNVLKWAEPHTRCPYCQWNGRIDDGCRGCHGLGWVTKQVFDPAPEDYRRAVESLSVRGGEE